MASIDAALKAVEDAKTTIDQGIHSAAQAIGKGAASAQVIVEEGYNSSLQVLDEAKGYVCKGIKEYQTYEDAVFASLTAGVHWAAANPYIAYPAAGFSALMLLPFTRRIMYRSTLGQLRNPESIVKSCDGKVKGISSKMQDWTGEVEKLRERMAKAEEEYKSGMAKLRATRQEMQRLSSSIAAGERAANAVVAELRTLSPKLDNVLQLRGEAAGHASVLRSQRYKVDKLVRRVANMDI